MDTSIDPDGDSSGESHPRSAFESVYQELFASVGVSIESRFIDLAEGRLHVFETGERNGDIPVVLVHGSDAFGGFFAPLLGHIDGWVVGFDRPGYGLSDPFVYREEDFRGRMELVVGGVLEAVGVERVDLVCHSMGGNIGFRFAGEHPDRVRRVITLGAIPGFPGTSPPLPIRLLTVPGLNRVVHRLLPTGEKGVLAMADVFGEREAIQKYPAFIRAIAAHEAIPSVARAGFSEFNAVARVMGWRSSIRIHEAELRAFETPIVVVWGDHDPLGCPSDVRERVSLIPESRFERLDAGHIPHLDYPDRCAAVINEMRTNSV